MRPGQRIVWDTVAAEKGEFPPLYGERDPRASQRDHRDYPRPGLISRGRSGVPGADPRRRARRRFNHCSSWPAGPRGTPAWSGSSSSRGSPGFRSRSTSPPSSLPRPDDRARTLPCGITESGETADTLAAMARRDRRVRRSPRSSTRREANRPWSTVFSPCMPAPRSSWPRRRPSRPILRTYTWSPPSWANGGAWRPACPRRRPALTHLARAVGGRSRWSPSSRSSRGSTSTRRLPLPGPRPALPVASKAR